MQMEHPCQGRKSTLPKTRERISGLVSNVCTSYMISHLPMDLLTRGAMKTLTPQHNAYYLHLRTSHSDLVVELLWRNIF